MKNSILILCCMFVFGVRVESQSVLSIKDTVTVEGATVWGGISYDGELINVTTMMQTEPSIKHLFLQKYDTTLNPADAAIQLTYNDDLLEGCQITDHKQLYLKGNIYIAYSLANTAEHRDKHLYLLKIDPDGNRIYKTAVIENSSDYPTNDMIFTTDSTFLYVLFFYPESRHWVYCYDQNLNLAREPLVTSIQLIHNNIGGVVFKDSLFYMFTGNFLAYNTNVILSLWNYNWTPAINQPRVIVETEDGDGNNFSTGCVFDEKNQRWYIAFHHFSKDQNPDDCEIDIAVLDDEFNLLERQTVTDINFGARQRPHFLLVGSTLYMTCDGGGVYIFKFHVNDATPCDLKITKSQLKPLLIHTEYADTLTVTGGLLPYSWQIVSGNLPQSLNLNSLNGIISGMISENGNFDFTVRVADSQNPPDEDQQEYHVFIALTGIQEKDTTSAKNTIVLPNYPNPFNSTTRIYYQLTQSANIQLFICNALGEKIKTLKTGNCPIGVHSINWDGRDENNNPVGSGIYFMILQTPIEQHGAKLLLLR